MKKASYKIFVFQKLCMKLERWIKTINRNFLHQKNFTFSFELKLKLSCYCQITF